MDNLKIQKEECNILNKFIFTASKKIPADNEKIYQIVPNEMNRHWLNIMLIIMLS